MVLHLITLNIEISWFLQTSQYLDRLWNFLLQIIINIYMSLNSLEVELSL